MSDQRRGRWANVVYNVLQMFCVCWVVAMTTFGPARFHQTVKRVKLHNHEHG